MIGAAILCDGPAKRNVACAFGPDGAAGQIGLDDPARPVRDARRPVEEQDAVRADAVVADDYTLTPATLTLTAGEVQTTAELELVDDQSKETTAETIILAAMVAGSSVAEVVQVFGGRSVTCTPVLMEGTGMTKKRRRFSAELKKRVALEALRERDTVQAVAARFEVYPNQVSAWNRQAVDGLEEVFRRPRRRGPRSMRPRFGTFTPRSVN